jgi:hypothetical protein
MSKLVLNNGEFECKTYLSQDRILVTDEFIKSNNLVLKPVSEIIEKIHEVKSEMFGFKMDILTDYLPAEDLEQFLNEEGKEELKKNPDAWKQITEIDEAAQDFLDYMNFAWGKALDERGLSAGRSISKLSAWLWLLGREDLVEVIENEDTYNPYGAPSLINVCNALSIPVPDSLIAFSKTKV